MSLRHRADWRALVFVAAYFVSLVGGWATSSSRPLVDHPLQTLLLVAWLCVLSWTVGVITHNVMHSPVWRARWLNRLTQVFLSLAYGFPVSEFIRGHNLSHHRYVQSRRDVMRTTKVDYQPNLLNLLVFFFRVARDVTTANYRYLPVMKARSPAWYRQLVIEIAAVWSVKIALVALDWQKGLLFVLLPHLYAAWGMTTVNYLQHDGCDPDNVYNQSRNFVGRLFNWWTFNNGYHTVHHLKPGLHWSLLPAAHQELVRPHMDPRLDEPSLTLYLWRTFVLPGQRRRYDGKPVVIENEGPDEPWLLPRKATSGELA